MTAPTTSDPDPGCAFVGTGESRLQVLVVPARRVGHQLRQPVRLLGHEGGDGLHEGTLGIAFVVRGCGLSRRLGPPRVRIVVASLDSQDWGR